jgi:hypothetical protein
MDGRVNPEVICRQNPDVSGIVLRDDKAHDITKESGHHEPVLKDARQKHRSLRTQECDLRGDGSVQELSSDNDCGLKDARAQHIFGTEESDLRGNSRVHELSSDHDCGLKDARAQQIFGTRESDLRGESRVHELSSDDNDCGLKDARAQHIFGTQERDQRGDDSRVQELSSEHDCGLKDARAQHIFGTHESDLRGESRVQELSSDHDGGLKDSSSSVSVPKDASEPEMDGEGDAIGQKLHNAASRGIADQKIQRVSYIKLHLCNAGRNRRYRWVVNIDAIDRY